MAASLQRVARSLPLPGRTNYAPSCLFMRHCHGNESEADGARLQRHYYKYFLPIQVRVADTDMYGHVNNSVYYSYFDTVINQYLIRHCGLDINLRSSDVVGYMVHTQCTFKKPLSFPDVVLAGLAVSRVGKSSVTYAVAVFAEKNSTEHQLPACGGHLDSTHLGSFEETASAIGTCIHAFVNTETDHSVEKLPQKMCEGLERIRMNEKSKL